MNKDLLVHINTNDPSQISIPLITDITTITGPIAKSRNRPFMFLKGFHLGPILDVDGKNASLTVTHK